jgi:hypothetical protein
MREWFQDTIPQRRPRIRLCWHPTPPLTEAAVGQCRPATYARDAGGQCALPATIPSSHSAHMLTLHARHSKQPCDGSAQHSKNGKTTTPSTRWTKGPTLGPPADAFTLPSPSHCIMAASSPVGLCAHAFASRQTAHHPTLPHVPAPATGHCRREQPPAIRQHCIHAVKATTLQAPGSPHQYLKGC